jgi:molybdopterin-guanine dinucleotide biosynthesis protein MobB
MVLVVAAVGVSGSGKTTTLEYLISRFSVKGYRVGAIKHIHHVDFSMDKPGTNTWRFAQAGAGVVVAVSPQEIDIIKKTTQDIQDLNKVLELLRNEDLDLLFIEGFHGLIAQHPEIIKIVTAKDQGDLKSTLELIKRPVLAIAGVVTQSSTDARFEQIPIIKIPLEGDKLVCLIEKELQKQNSPL